jgi:tetratricopeptide (TPR) repeat protein
MMRSRRRGPTAVTVLLASAAVLSAPAYGARCRFIQLAQLPVTLNGTQPTVHAQINGADAVFIADSGAFYSTLTAAAAAEFKLRLHDVRSNFVLIPETEVLRGVGGRARTWFTEVKTFTLAGTPIHNIEFLVTPNDFGQAVGLLGQNVLRIGDVEYDLANGVIRLIQPHDCKSADLAYWVKAGQSYSVLDIEASTAQAPHTSGVAYLNGSKIQVVFDTGAATSALTLAAARRAGVTPNSPGVVAGGTMSGVGRRAVQSWIAPFASLKIGDEEIRNIKLRVGDIDLFDRDMLLGVDFFLSHRVYVANSQRKLYFTYNGGPVFNLKTLSADTPTAAGAAAAEAPLDDQPSDADGFARRGAASRARHDYEHALADLTRACELAPTEAAYFYERGLAHLGNNQSDLALADFDQAIQLKPEHVLARLARAELRVKRGDSAGAVADLDATDRAAAAQAPVRLRLGVLYMSAGQFGAAVAQSSQWISAHDPDDVAMSSALNLRCWARAQWGQELALALADCDQALRMRPDMPEILAGRGLVHLRRREWNKAIADYEAALHLQPKSAWSLYGRGIARLRQGAAAQGQADLAAASALDPKIPAEAAKAGISP